MAKCGILPKQWSGIATSVCAACLYGNTIIRKPWRTKPKLRDKSPVPSLIVKMMGWITNAIRKPWRTKPKLRDNYPIPGLIAQRPDSCSNKHCKKTRLFTQGRQDCPSEAPHFALIINVHTQCAQKEPSEHKEAPHFVSIINIHSNKYCKKTRLFTQERLPTRRPGGFRESLGSPLSLNPQRSAHLSTYVSQ